MWIVLVAAALAGLPMEEVRWDIAVRGPVAEAIVTQRFTGPVEAGQRAQFMFALPHEGVVDDMTMVIGDTIIHSALRESRQARQEFEVAALDGQIAGLTTQVAGGVFQQELANVPAGQDIEVQLRVLWPVTRTGGQFELVVPTNVAPRFATGFGTHNEFTVRQPYPVRVDADIEAGFDIASLHSPTHTGVNVTTQDSHAGVHWQDRHASGDMILRWENNTGDTQAAAITSGDHSLLVMEGPAPTRGDSGAVEWVLVLDTSGSMSGTPWRRAMGVANNLLANVGPEDTIGLLTFGQSIRSLPPASGARGVELVRQRLAQEGPSGGTLLPSALSAATALPHDGAMRRVMVLITDGLVTDEDGSLTALASAGQRADLAILGVNASPNRALLDRLAVAANGTSSYYLPGDTSDSVTDRLLTAVDNAKCTDVRVEWSTGVQAWPTEPGPLVAGIPVVIAAQHRDTPTWVEVSCRLNGQRWARRVTPTQVDRGRGLQAAWARRNLEALLHDGWATGTDPRLKATALALEYGILSPWTSLVAVESRPDGDGRHALADVDVPEQGTNKPASVTVDDVRRVEYQNPSVDTSSTTRGQVLTRDFLNQIPAGRSYDSAVGMAVGVVGGGGNPNIAGGATSENTYLLDGITITDPVTGTFSLNVNQDRPSSVQPELRTAPSPAPNGPSGSNAIALDFGGAGGTGGQYEAHGAASGSIVRDRLWLLARMHHNSWGPTNAQHGGTRLTYQPTAKHRFTADAAIQNIDTDAKRLDRRDVSGVWQWFTSPSLVLTNRVDGSSLRVGRTLRHAAIATSDLHIIHSRWELGGQVRLGHIRLEDDTRNWIGRAEVFARLQLADLWHLDGTAGVAGSGTTAPTGRLALRGSLPRGKVKGALVAEQTVPDLSALPGDVSTLPIQRRVAGTVSLQLLEDFWLGTSGQLDDNTTWATSMDGLAVTGSGRLLSSRGPSGSLWLEKEQSRRWHAKVSWLVSARTAVDGALQDPDIEEIQGLTNSLRPHRVLGSIDWKLPTDPWTMRLRLNGQWASAIQGIDARWAAPRLSLGVGLEQEIDTRRGKLVLHAGVRHGVAAGLGSLTIDSGPTIQWNRLSEGLQDKTHVQFGLTWRT